MKSNKTLTARTAYIRTARTEKLLALFATVSAVRDSMEEKLGKIIHYFDKIGVAVIKLDAPLKVGDTVNVKGKTSDFEQAVGSMQVDKKPVEAGKKGDEVAVKLDSPAKEGDMIFKR